MLVINSEQVRNLIRQLDTPGGLNQCQGEVEKMLEINSELLWWAESGKCCSRQVRSCLTGEVQILESVLNFLKEGNIPEASLLLEEYLNQVQYAESGLSKGDTQH